MKIFKNRYEDQEELAKHEFKWNFLASFLGGAIGSGLTNGLDVLTINRQTNPKYGIK